MLRVFYLRSTAVGGVIVIIIVVGWLSLTVRRLSLTVRRLTLTVGRLTLSVRRLTLSVRRLRLSIELLSLTVRRLTLTVGRLSTVHISRVDRLVVMGSDHIGTFDQLIGSNEITDKASHISKNCPKQISATVKIVFPKSSGGGVADAIGYIVPPDDAVYTASHDTQKEVHQQSLRRLAVILAHFIDVLCQLVYEDQPIDAQGHNGEKNVHQKASVCFYFSHLSNSFHVAYMFFGISQKISQKRGR